MNLIFKVLVTCCLLQTSAFAETSKKIEYANQKVEAFNLDSYLKEIKMIDQEVKATCERKVPYQENVCKDVTKYKKECATVPAHEECKQVNNPICHTETTMENECHNLPSTQECRQVPNRVCSTETRYENECSTTPDRQECRNVTEQECNYETKYENECRTVPGEQQCRVVVRYRQECSTEGGGQQCRTIPGDVQCSIINGENRCTKIPPRQECTNEPTRQVCRQVPYEERECSTGPSRQECQQVPRQERVCRNVSRQQCDTVPGRYECRQVPRQEQVCRNEMKQECTTIPGDEVCADVPRQHEVCRDNYSTKCENVPAKEVCKNVPYKEQVCKMETKYKKEEYECTKVIQVPQEKLLKTHKANVKVEFSVLSEILGPEFNFELDENGKLAITAEANNDEYYGNSKAVVFAKKDVKSKDAGEINSIEATYKVLMMDSKTNLAYMNTNDIYGTLKKYSISFKLMGKVDPKRATLGLKIMRKDIIEIDKPALSKGNIEYVYNKEDETTTVTVDLKGEGAKVGSILTTDKTQYDTTITFSQNYSDVGDLILGRAQNLTWKMNRILQLTK